MNILFLYRFPLIPTQGGIERVSFLLAKEFQKNGNKVSFLATNSCPGKTIENNLEFEQLYIDCKEKNYINNFFNIINKYNPDVIINQGLNQESYLLLKSLRENKDYFIKLPKIVSVLHNKPFSIEGIGRIFKRISYSTSFKGHLYRYFGIFFPSFYESLARKQSQRNLSNFIHISDKFYLLSQLFKPKLLKYLPNIDFHKIEAINNPNTFSLKIDEKIKKENIILFVGRLLEPQKNVKGFIDVWKEFYKNHPSWKGLIVGDGEHRHQLEKYAKDKKAKNLEFVGNSENIANYYSKAKFLCMTSLYEGWPMVLAEAMSYGCIPCVYNTFESASEILNNSSSGILVEPFNKHKMVQEMALLAENESLQLAMIKNGQEHIKKYNIENISSIWLTKLYDLTQIKN